MESEGQKPRIISFKVQLILAFIPLIGFISVFIICIHNYVKVIGNNFKCFLYGALTILLVVLLSFGPLYLIANIILSLSNETANNVVNYGSFILAPFAFILVEFFVVKRFEIDSIET